MTARRTLEDVAAHAGVSKATVSLVCRNSPLVAEATRLKVEAAMQAVGYVYHRSAANLRAAQTGLVGLVLPDLANPVFAELIAGVESVLKDSGQHVLIAHSGESLQEQAKLLQHMLEMRVDGLIISAATGTTADCFRAYTHSQTPVVQALRRFAGQAHDYAGTNNYEGVRTATQQAVALGHHRIAFMGSASATSVSQERQAGYAAALQEAGIAPEPRLLRNCAPDLEAAAQTAIHLLQQPEPPTAIICFSDVMAFGATLGVYRLHMEPGKQVSVIGFDDVPWARSWRPALSTMAINPYQIGRDAAELLQQRICNPDQAPQARIHDAVWTPRASSAAPM